MARDTNIHGAALKTTCSNSHDGISLLLNCCGWHPSCMRNISFLAPSQWLQLLYLLGSLIYNVYFHPLRSYPGPKLSAGTKFPYAWARIRGEVPAHVAALHARYGPVVRVSPRELSYITAEAWRDIYGHNIGGRGGLEKDLSFYGPDTVGSNSIIRTNDVRQRRLLAHAFSGRALRDQEPLIQRYVGLLSEKMGEIAKTADATFDMVRYLNCCTFDIMGDMAFGEPLGLLEKSDYTGK